MILLDGDLKFFMTIPENNRRILSFIKGTYLRCVQLTIIDNDKPDDDSAWGWFYLGTENVLLCMQVRGSHYQLFELEAKDTLRLVDKDNGDVLLTNAMNGQSIMESFGKVTTSQPINFVELNHKYLLLVGIQQPFGDNLGRTTYVGTETIVVDKDYKQKNANLLQTISAIVHRTAIDPALPLPGSNMQNNPLIRYAPTILVLVFIAAVFIVIFVIRSQS